MRSSSSGISRKTERRIKIIFLIIALLFGIFMSLVSKWHLFVLKGIETEPDKLLPHSAVWCNVTRFQERFCPALYISKRSYEKKIDLVYPAQTRLTISSWGTLKLKIIVTEPIVKICWNGKYWYVSDEGTIWPEDIEENNILSFKRVKDMPVLFWGEDRTAPCEIGAAAGNIKKCALPINQIKGWYDNMRSLGWIDKVLALKTETNDGQQVVRLIFKDRSGHTGVSLLMPETGENWIVAGLAVNKICPDLQELSENDFIDATYNGKILVKNALQ